MNSTSKHVLRYLSTASQLGDEAPETAPESKPATPQIALLRRIRKIVFGPNVKDLETALDRYDTIVDSLDDTDEKPEEKPV